MMSYFFEVTIYWSAFYIFYFLLFSRETFFNGNRFYLLATFFAGLVLPLIELSGYVPESNVLEMTLPAIQITADGVSQPGLSEKESVFTIFNLLKIVLLLGAIVTAARFIIGFSKINRLKKTAKRSLLFGTPVLLTSKIHTPFSFFNNLFWSTGLAHLGEEQQRQIVLHESAHIKKKHSLDVVLIELVMIVFWWNPLAYAYKKALREVHEFEADDYAIRQTNKQQYGRLLITQSRTFTDLLTGRNSPTLANHFFHSQLKKRIMMMTKKKSTEASQWKYLLVLPLLMTLIFACETVVQNEIPNEGAIAKIASDKSNMNFVIDTAHLGFDAHLVDTALMDRKSEDAFWNMPRFPGCEDMEDGKLVFGKCSISKVTEYIHLKIKYPEKAKKNATEGSVFVAFTIPAEQGGVRDIEFLESVSPEIDAEVVRVLNEMPAWIPGSFEGKNVAVRFRLPINFKLK